MSMFKIIRVSGSFLSIDYENEQVLDDALAKLEKSGANFVHFDVMDGKFVDRKTYDHTLVKNVQEKTSLMLDVHLMVENPQNVVEDYIKSGADIVTVHYESTSIENLEKILAFIKSKAVLAGVSLSPETPAYKIKDLLKKDLVDVVLVMGVKPGASGQDFIPGSAEKVAEIREMSKGVYIAVDGGINSKNSKILRKLGANILVVGSHLFASKNMKKTIKALKGNNYASRIKEFFKKS